MGLREVLLGHLQTQAGGGGSDRRAMWTHAQVHARRYARRSQEARSRQVQPFMGQPGGCSQLVFPQLL